MCGMNCSQSLGASLVAVMDWSTSERSMDEVEAENKHAAKHTGEAICATNSRNTLNAHIDLFPCSAVASLRHTIHSIWWWWTIFFWTLIMEVENPMCILLLHPWLISIFSVSKQKEYNFDVICFFSQTWGTAVFINWHYLKCLCNMDLIAILHTEVVH